MDKIQSKNNNANALYKRIINDLALKRVTTDLKGVQYLTEAIDAYVSAPHSSIIEIYESVAEKHGVNRKTVMREISYALSRVKLDYACKQ